MKYEIKEMVCLLVLSLFLWKPIYSQTIDLIIENTGLNHVRIKGMVNDPGEVFTSNWNSAQLVLRLPISVTGKTESSTTSGGYGTPDPDITNFSTPWAGAPLADQFGAPSPATYTPSDQGGTNDGFLYILLTSNSAVASVNHNDMFVIAEFDLPVSWTCTNCMEIVTDNPSPFFTPSDAYPQILNTGSGASTVATVGTQFTSLPIELLLFEPRTNKCDVSLYWETASEKNFGYFQIEASRDGRIFTSAGQQKPASPNSTTKRVYKYSIPSNLQDHYFRLKAVDLDGTFEYSPVVYAKAPCEGKHYEMQLYPNPNFTSELMVEVISPEEVEKVELHLLDAYGKLIRIQKVDQVEVGSNKIPIETADLPTGTYFIKIKGIDQLQTPLKFIRSNF